MTMKKREEKFLRLQQVLDIIPISRSAWWQGCKDGRYPKPIKLAPRTSVWKASEIYELVDKLAGNISNSKYKR